MQIRKCEIYIILNTVNGKRYVGQTTVGAEERLKVHRRNARKRSSTHTPLYNAIRKYGADAFVIERTIPCQFEELDCKEKEIVADLGTLNPDKGYNVLSGGGRPTPEDLERMSETSKRLWEQPDYRQKVAQRVREAKSTPEAKAQMSEAQKAAWKRPRKPISPYKRSESFKQKQRERMLHWRAEQRKKNATL
jgi:group I intron endonuclease